ncbi:hypothetical protein TNCV_2724541 [Trichonephila clavipes]|nr:hypothetical protein TNCV_2724541 [Trichonephila clavipes]
MRSSTGLAPPLNRLIYPQILTQWVVMSLVTLFLRLALEILAKPILLLLSIDISKFGVYNESSDFCLKVNHILGHSLPQFMFDAKVPNGHRSEFVINIVSFAVMNSCPGFPADPHYKDPDSR